MRQHSRAKIFHAPIRRADIPAAPAGWLPRRQILRDWQVAFLLRAAAPVCELAPLDADDLRERDLSLRARQVPAAG